MAIDDVDAGVVDLRPLRPSDRDMALAAHEELAADDFMFLLDGFDPAEPWDVYLERLERGRHGDVAPGRVPATFLVAVDADDVIVGRVSIRHQLNDYLVLAGGHIGYGVRPGFRRRGYATQILTRALVIARGLGIADVLVTCDDDNAGSAAVIEACGGVLENVVTVEGEAPKRRYWIRSEPDLVDDRRRQQ